jgi:RNA polymerase sigma-70 factor (ECF subfamily)
VKHRRRGRHQGALARSRNNPACFAEVYDALAPGLLRFFTRQTAMAQVALDLTAETLAIAYESRATFRGESDVEAAAWIWTIARHELAGFWRERQAGRAAIVRLGMALPEATEDEIARIVELGAIETGHPHVHDALLALPPEQREAVLMHVVEGLSYSEIATHLDVSNDVVRARASRGLRAMRENADLRKWHDANE